MRRSTLLGGALVCLGLIPVSGVRAATTINVGPTRTYKTIQAGINAASPGDTVLVDSNTTGYPAYTGSGNRDIDFNDKAITVQGVGGATSCIIDIQNSSGHRGFLFNGTEGSGSVLIGFTITNGNITGTSDGGGIKCINGSAPTIQDCRIQYNHAGGKGGGIYCDGSSPTLVGCEIAYNDAGNGGGGNGGGIALINDSSPSITDCQIHDNASDVNGGGIWMNYGCSPIIKDCDIYANATQESNGDGGGISVKGSGSSPYFARCKISDNDAPYGAGGALYVEAAFVKLVNCVMNTNYAGGAGGAALLVYGSGADLELQNCTVFGNKSHSFGGAFYVNGGSDLSLTIRNSIVWGNEHYGYGSSYTSNQFYLLNSPVVDVAHTCVDGGWTGTGNISSDPKLASDGYHIATDSPCIDTGNNSYFIGPYDIDGEDRIYNMTVDMGVDEIH